MKIKKYKTLRTVVDFFSDNDIITHKWLSEFFTEKGVNFLIREECIQEIQESEFTKIDMINFADYYLGKVRAGIKPGITFYANDSFYIWINENKK